MLTIDDLIPAVAYYRMSSDEQTLSIGQQRKEVRDWAGHNGYTIIREYIDEGKTGSKASEQDKRLDFQRMLLDSNNKDFKAILCWNTSRFSRLDSMDSGFAKIILRGNGVCLHTVREGRIDWSTFEGRIQDALLSEFNHMYSRSLSADSVRGRADVVEAGYWAVGPVPYGYDKMMFDTVTGKTQLIRRTERFTKPDNWRTKLHINEDEAKIVRYIYSEFLNDRSMRDIAKELNLRCVPVPGDWYRHAENGWTWDNIKGILRHKAYIGVASIGHGRARKKDVFNRARKTESENAHAPIIDRPIWEEVQQRLADNKKEKRKPKPCQASALSGILHCGHCGYRLSKKVAHQFYCCECGENLARVRSDFCPHCRSCIKHNKVKRPRVYYACTTSTRQTNACPQWRVFEDEILPTVRQHLIDKVDAELVRILQQPKEEAPVTDLRIADEQVKAIRLRLDRILDRIETADPEMLPEYEGRAQKLRQELTEAEGREQVLRAVQQEGGVDEFRRWWDDTKSVLATAPVPPREDEDSPAPPQGVFILNIEPDKLRPLFRKLGFSVRLFWKKKNQRLYELDKANTKVSIKWFSENLVKDDTSTEPHKVLVLNLSGTIRF